MGHRRLRPSACIGALVALLLVLSPTVRASAAAANTTNRAGVIVDEGNGTVKRVGITFSGTISGITALQLAGFAPTVRTFGGVGGAVCALDIGGTRYGCPADGTCLTCAAPDYWTYSRATKGTSSFTIWPAGAGSTQVHDGDIEGWRWSTGASPAYVPLNSFFPPPTTTTTAAPPTTTPHVTTPRTTAPHGPGVYTQGSVPPTVLPTTTAASNTKPGPRGSASSTTTPSATGTARRGSKTSTTKTSGSSSARAGPDGRDVNVRRVAASPPIVHDASGTSPAVWIVFATIVAAFAVAIGFAHRRRARATTD